MSYGVRIFQNCFKNRHLLPDSVWLTSPALAPKLSAALTRACFSQTSPHISYTSLVGHATGLALSGLSPMAVHGSFPVHRPGSRRSSNAYRSPKALAEGSSLDSLPLPYPSPQSPSPLVAVIIRITRSRPNRTILSTVLVRVVFQIGILPRRRLSFCI